MPTHREIRAKIAEKIFALDNAVAVHEYERYTRNMSDLVAMYKSGDADNPRLHGWYVRLVATKEVFVNVSRWSIWHTWRMRGFNGLGGWSGVYAPFTGLTITAPSSTLRNPARHS